MEYKFLVALTIKVSRSKYPSMAQLTSLIWSFLYVQTYLMPRRVSMNVKCLFQSSIYTIKMSHQTLLIISSAVPRYFVTPSLIFLTSLTSFSENFCFFGSCFEAFASKTGWLASMNLLKNGTMRFLETISKTESKTLVFLLSKTPQCQQCCSLYMAMQVYSSPRRLLQKLMVDRLQQMSGMAEINFIKNREDFIFLLVVDESSSVNATLKSEQNLFRYLPSRLWSLRISGLLLCTNIAIGN